MSPTSSRVDRPTATSSVAERDSGRITSSAPIRSSWVSAGGLSSALARAAARNAASRTSAARSATTKPGVRAAISSRSSSPAGTSRSSTSSSCLRMAPSGRRGQFAVAQIRCPQPRIDVSGSAVVATNATPGWRTAVRSSVRISVATGSAVGGQQRVDIGDQQHAAAVTTVGHRRRDARSRSSARSAPTSGRPVRRAARSAHTAAPAWPCRRRPARRPARRDWLWRPRVSSNSGSSSASLSHSASRPAWRASP